VTNNYARGAEFERRTKRHLETNGYTVMRSAGSHSLVDLIALKPGQTVLVQCKINGVLGPTDRARMVALAEWLTYPGGDVVPVLATKPPRGGGPIDLRLIAIANCHERWTIDYA
jgi:Holliday junction resolvase